MIYDKFFSSLLDEKDSDYELTSDDENIYDENIYDENIYDENIYDENIYDENIYDENIYDDEIDKQIFIRLQITCDNIIDSFNYIIDSYDYILHPFENVEI